MFTGLIQHVGSLLELRPRGGGYELVIEAIGFIDRFLDGESIAVDGCCLTVESFSQDRFVAFASPETLQRTTLSDRKIGDALNLERALALGDRLGGHMVSGHVDGTGSLREARNLGESWEVWVNAPLDILDQCIRKGSIAIDGISLTIVEIDESGLSAAVIPETWERTTLSRRRPGQRVNLETDMIGKYVRRTLEQMGIAEGQTRLADVWKNFRS